MTESVHPHPHFLRPDVQVSHLGSGKRSDSFHILGSGRMFKRIRQAGSPEKTQALAQKLIRDYYLLEIYMYPYAVATTHIIGGYDDRKGAAERSVTIIQPHIHGIPFNVALERILHKKADGVHVKSFLQKALRMYQETGHIPDIFGPFRPSGFQPNLSRNVVVLELKCGLFPVLVDTNFARKSEHPILRNIVNPMLAHDIWRLGQSLP